MSESRAGAAANRPLGDRRLKDRLPTVDGDVVIVHCAPSEYDVWLVIEDGQQARDERLFKSMRVHNQATAAELARAFVIQTGTVYVVEQDAQTWTTVAV
jgi:hypothetical protein